MIDRVKEATVLLASVGVPVAGMTKRRRQRVALALLAVADLKPSTPWKSAKCIDVSKRSMKTRDILNYWNEHYGEKLAQSSYDDVRREDLVYLIEAGLAIPAAGRPGAATNDGQRGYAISKQGGPLLRAFGTVQGKDLAEKYRAQYGTLEARLERRRKKKGIPVVLPDGIELELTVGIHNELQKSIVEDFVPRFIQDPRVLYIGDTSAKRLHVDEDGLSALGFPELSHERLPDVVVQDGKRGWLFLIEAVHSSNPISKLRHLVLERMTEKCTAPRIYVSVFKDRAALRKYVADISWETEVWLSEEPSHVIHFDGEKYMSPYVGDEGGP